MVATKILNNIEVDGNVKATSFTGPLTGNVTGNVSGSSGSCTGNATTATTASKLSSNAGSSTQPIYFENGVPKATTYALNKTVPSNAVFTDTKYSAASSGGLSLSGTEFSVKTGYTTSGKNYAVTKDSSGNLYVNVPWTDNNTTYESKSAVSGGTDVSLVTTGEKYTWNNKANTASPAFSGTPTAPTANTGTNSTQIATTAFVRAEVDSRLAANDAMLFKGTIGTGGTVTALPATHNAGWTYKVITAGTYAGKVCEVGDMIMCITDGTAASDAHWTVVQTNIDGAVTGPASSTNGHIAIFNGTTGKIVKDSGYTIATSVPSGAKFTDTTYTAGDGLSLSGTVFTPNTSFTTSGKNYAVKVDSTSKGLYVNVPWSDNNTTYSAASGGGLELSGTAFSVKTGYTTTDKNYAVQKDTNGNLYVNVPWTDHTYTVNNGTLSIQGNGTTASTFTANQSGNTTLNIKGSGTASVTKSADNEITISSADQYTGTVTTTGTMTSGNVILSNGGTVIKDSGFTIGKSVPSNALFTDTDVRNTAGSTENANKLFLIGATSQGANPQTYSSSKVYETDGKLVATKIDATQNGGMKNTFTLKATGVKTILQMKDAATFWTTNNGCAYIKALIHYSTVAQGTATATGTKMGTWLIEATYSGTQHAIYATEINANAANATGVVRYFYSHAPKSASYAPNIAIALYDASTTVYITPTILSATEGWEIPATIGGDPGTTNYNRYTAEMGRYNYNWSSLKMATNITGAADGIASSTWDTIRNDRLAFGESAVSGSIMALSNNGYHYKLSDTTKEFMLPLQGGRCTGSFTYNGSVTPPTLTKYAQLMWCARGTAWAELTNTTMQTTAFTVPTLSAGDWGKTLYVTGSISNGCFKPDGNIVFTMQNGKTNIPIGRIDRADQALNTVPSQFTIMMYGQNAYTLDSNGKLTHIDGREVKDTTYSLATVATTGSYNDLSNKPTIPTVNNATLAIQGNGTTASSFTANSASNVTLNIKGSGATTVTKSANNEITISSTDNNTLNTAGSTDTNSKIFLVGATSQAANPQTYSHDTVFVDTDGCINSTTPASGNNSTKVATTAFVKSAIDGIPTPMQFKGTVGTNGTITSLPTAAAANQGFVYKAITAASSPVAYKVGDTLVSDGSAWVVIPSGDEPSGTVTNVATGVGLTGGAITSTGTIKAKLRSETALTNDSAAATETSGRVYPVAVDKSGYLAVNVPWTDHTYTVNNGTLAIQGSGTTASSFTANNSGNVTLNIKGSGATTVTKTADNEITVSSTDNDTKNTAGTTASTGTKLFLVGAASQAANPQTYSNANCYVGTDNCLYSGGTKVLTAHQSLTNYVTKTGSESISNKTITGSTYNGYTLGAACAKGVASSIASGGTDLATSGQVYSASHMNTATVTVPAAGGAVTVSGMTASAIVWVSPAPASFSDYTAAGCYCSAQAANSLTFTVAKTAAAAMSVNVVWREP